jgi:hypothetical protein
MGVISIPHKPQHFTHVPNSQLATNSFSAILGMCGVSGNTEKTDTFNTDKAFSVHR